MLYEEQQQALLCFLVHSVYNITAGAFGIPIGTSFCKNTRDLNVKEYKARLTIE